MDNSSTLYIIMREDLPDLNPGKGMAQAAHAQALFTQGMLDHYDYEDWCGKDGFGRTLVVIDTLENIKHVTDNVLDGHAGIVVDPTYPYRNYHGNLFTTSTETCGWFFSTPYMREEHPLKSEMVSNMRLHP